MSEIVVLEYIYTIRWSLIWISTEELAFCPLTHLCVETIGRSSLVFSAAIWPIACYTVGFHKLINLT